MIPRFAKEVQAFWRTGTAQSGAVQHDSPSSGPAPRRATLRTFQCQSVSRWTTVFTLLLGDALGFFLMCTSAYVTALARVPGAAEQVYPVSIVLAPALFLALGLSGFYQFQFTHPTLEMQRLATLTGVITGTAVLTVFLATGDWQTALLVASAGLTGTIALPIARGLTRILFACRSWWGISAIVVSSEENGSDILDTLNRWPEIGLRPVAVLSGPNAAGSSDSTLDHPDWASYLSRMFGTSYAIISVPELPRAAGEAHHAVHEVL